MNDPRKQPTPPERVASGGTDTLEIVSTPSIPQPECPVNPQLAEAQRLFIEAETVKHTDYAAYWRLRRRALLLQAEAMMQEAAA